MGAIKKQFHVGDNVRIRMAPLNRPLPKLHSKWSKLYRIVAMKGVVVTVKDPETEETITVHVDRLAFSDPRLRDEIALEPFVPFDVPFHSVSNSLPNLLCERHLDQYTLPSSTSVHTHTPTPKPLDFLDQPSAQGKRGVRINRDPDYAYILVSRTNMATESSGARHADQAYTKSASEISSTGCASQPLLRRERSSHCCDTGSGTDFLPRENGDIVLLSGRSGRIHQRIRRSIPWVL